MFTASLDLPRLRRHAMPWRHGPPPMPRTSHDLLDVVVGMALAWVLLLPVCLGAWAFVCLAARPDLGDDRGERSPPGRTGPTPPSEPARDRPGPGRSPRGPKRSSLALKRALDLVVASLALLVLSPLLGIVALAIRLQDGGPVMFRQARIGRGGAPFAIHKFRTMVVGAPSIGGRLTVGRDPRITRIGAVLRRHKLDELPQLLDIVAGHMSLVGPRPEVPELMAEHGAAHVAIITSVRPGLTDDASILFRDEGALLAAAPDPEAYYRTVIIPIKYDYYERYLGELGVANDLRIIAATAILLATGRIPAALDRRRLAIPDGFGALSQAVEAPAPQSAPIGRAA